MGLYHIERYGARFFAVIDECGRLVVVTVYLKGAREVVVRLCGVVNMEVTGP